MSTLPAETDCELWLADTPPDPGACIAMLDTGERAAMKRLRHTRLQNRYALGHALVRCAIARCTGDDPAALSFERTAEGRPALLTGSNPHAHDFNLSYSGSRAACAIARGVRVGVDLETVSDAIDPTTLAPRVLAQGERECLAGLDPAAGRRFFFRAWTLKEAYAKARGEGLGVDFAALTLHTREGSICADLDGVGDSAARWQFDQYAVAPDQYLAVALRHPGRVAPASAFRIAVRWTRVPELMPVPGARVRAVAERLAGLS